MTDPKRDSVKIALESLGFTVAVIPEAPPVQRADLRAVKDGIATIVEVKSRLEDPKLKALAESVRPGEEPKQFMVSAGKTNHFSATAGEANDQLAATATSNDFRVFWFWAEEDPGLADVDVQMKATLLGTRLVFGNKDGTGFARHCYYAGFGDFFRFREIDAAVIYKDTAATLIPNHHSPRRTQFEVSPIYRTFSALNGVTNIHREEAEGHAYIVDGDVDRRNDQAVLSFLRTKYQGTEFQALADLKTRGAVMALPTPPHIIRPGA